MQNLLSRQSQKGLTFTGILMIISLVALAWLAGHWAIGYFGSTKAQKILIESVLKNKSIASDDELKAALLEDLKIQGPIDAPIEALSIFRSQDGHQAKIIFKYNYAVVVPLTDFGFQIPFNIEFEENLNRKRVF
jgi:hypothetical protein